MRGEPQRFGAAPRTSDRLPGGQSEREPPDPIPNSEVKTLCADGSVPCRHARVGHCQALKRKAPGVVRLLGLFSLLIARRGQGNAMTSAAPLPLERSLELRDVELHV